MAPFSGDAAMLAALMSSNSGGQALSMLEQYQRKLQELGLADDRGAGGGSGPGNMSAPGYLGAEPRKRPETLEDLVLNPNSDAYDTVKKPLGTGTAFTADEADSLFRSGDYSDEEMRGIGLTDTGIEFGKTGEPTQRIFRETELRRAPFAPKPYLYETEQQVRPEFASLRDALLAQKTAARDQMAVALERTREQSRARQTQEETKQTGQNTRAAMDAGFKNSVVNQRPLGEATADVYAANPGLGGQSVTPGSGRSILDIILAAGNGIGILPTTGNAAPVSASSPLETPQQPMGTTGVAERFRTPDTELMSKNRPKAPQNRAAEPTPTPTPAPMKATGKRQMRQIGGKWYILNGRQWEEATPEEVRANQGA